MTERSITRGRVFCLLLNIAVLLALIPVLSAGASATEGAAANEWVCMDFTGGQVWSYVDPQNVTQEFTRSSLGDVVRAKYWTWYGKADNGFEANTLFLKDGFEIDTTDHYGIMMYSGTTSSRRPTASR